MSRAPRPQPALDPAYRALIESDRVSEATRGVLLARAESVDASDPSARGPNALHEDLMRTLRAVLDRLLPDIEIDLAARLDASIAAGKGDGWRFADLPPDIDAYRIGLSTIEALALQRHNTSFAHLGVAQQDECLIAYAETLCETPSPQPTLSASQMKHWISDLRADAVTVYMSHPATLARIGYSGIALGGDQPRLPGFKALGLGQREPWEPVAIASAELPS